MARIGLNNNVGVLQSTISRHDILELSETVNELPGIVDIQVKTDNNENIAVVSYKTNGTSLRDIITKIKDLGYS